MQADLHLCCLQTSEGRFSHVEAQFIFYLQIECCCYIERGSCQLHVLSQRLLIQIGQFYFTDEGMISLSKIPYKKSDKKTDQCTKDEKLLK